MRRLENFVRAEWPQGVRSQGRIKQSMIESIGLEAYSEEVGSSKHENGNAGINLSKDGQGDQAGTISAVPAEKRTE